MNDVGLKIVEGANGETRALKLRCRATASYESFGTDVRLWYEDPFTGGIHTIFTDIMLKTLGPEDNGVFHKPTLTLDDDGMQAIMDALWLAGGRPSPKVAMNVTELEYSKALSADRKLEADRLALIAERTHKTLDRVIEMVDTKSKQRCDQR